ncbi:MAG: DUF4893 domain-containing protein [Pseudomonadota bacterium]
MPARPIAAAIVLAAVLAAPQAAPLAALQAAPPAGAQSVPTVDAAARWQSVATETDVARHAAADAVLGYWFADTYGRLSAEERRIVGAVYADAPRAFTPDELVGTWLCRTIKLGGISGTMIAYPYFRCRIEADAAAEGAVLFFIKETGSQRSSGRIWPGMRRAPARPAGRGHRRPAASEMVYLGAGHYGREGVPRPYRARGATGSDERNQIGRVTMRGARALIELPQPRRESVFNILELRRP